MNIKSLAKKISDTALKPFGYKIVSNFSALPAELDSYEKELIQYVINHRYTMVPIPGLINTVKSCRYVVENEIPGDFVECGVWRGGNAILAKSMFEYLGSDKKVWLFDTFEGMAEPTEKDFNIHTGEAAFHTYEKNQKPSHNNWCYASIEDVKNNLMLAKVDMESLVFVRGDVNETLLKKTNLPNSISILRLDTDWYESTKTEMEVLYPILNKGGVIIIDDYGYWDGSRRAVDEYFSSSTHKPLLNVVYIAGTRSGIKI